LSDAIDSGKGTRGPDATGTASNEYIDMGAYEYRSSVPVSKVYWTDRTDNAIYRANENGTSPHALWSVQKIAATSMEPQDIEYDSNNNQLFWTESNGNFGNVVVADIDGQNTSIALNNGIAISNGDADQVLAPYGMTIDESSSTLYVLSDAHAGNDASATNKILAYQINGSTLSYADTPFEGVLGSVNPMSFGLDIDHYHSANGDEWLAWSDNGDPFLSFDPSVSFFNLTTNNFYRNVNTGAVLPQGVSWNPDTGEVLVADQSDNLGAPDIEYVRDRKKR